jgi:hypothetical protein
VDGAGGAPAAVGCAFRPALIDLGLAHWGKLDDFGAILGKTLAPQQSKSHNPFHIVEWSRDP